MCGGGRYYCYFKSAETFTEELGDLPSLKSTSWSRLVLWIPLPGLGQPTKIAGEGLSGLQITQQESRKEHPILGPLPGLQRWSLVGHCFCGLCCPLVVAAPSPRLLPGPSGQSLIIIQ